MDETQRKFPEITVAGARFTDLSRDGRDGKIFSVNQLPHDLRSSYKRSCQQFLSEARTLSPEDRQGHEKESIQRQQRLIAAGMDSFLPVPNGLDVEDHWNREWI